MIAPRLSAKLKAGIVSNVIDYQKVQNPLKVKRQAFRQKQLNSQL